MRIFQICFAVLLTTVAITNAVYAANEYIGSQFTDGIVFSEVVVEDHLFALPFPNVHSPLATGHIESWLLHWNIANLKTNQPNRPDQIIYLARQNRTGQILDGFRASASTNFVVCNPSAGVELWSILAKNPARLLKSLPADDPATTPPPARLFSRSEKYFFLWKPTPAIYAVSNLSVAKQIKMTENFKKFEADLRKQGGWQETLTDDLKYLIHVPLEFGGPFNQETFIETPHTYDLETDEYATGKVHVGTNGIVIVDAESIDGRPNFIAFWKADGARRLGILDRDSQIVAELPTEGTTDTQFSRNSDWDYAHSRFLVRESGGNLTIYDYRAKRAQHFTLVRTALKVP